MWKKILDIDDSPAKVDNSHQQANPHNEAQSADDSKGVRGDGLERAKKTIRDQEVTIKDQQAIINQMIHEKCFAEDKYNKLLIEHNAVNRVTPSFSARRFIGDHVETP